MPGITTTDAKILGYAGMSIIDGQNCLLSGGGYNKENSVSYIEAYDISPTLVNRSRMLHADGVSAYNGTISLDVTSEFLDLLSVDRLFARRYKFPVILFDGMIGRRMSDCYLSSLTVSGSSGGLISAELSFVFPKAPTEELVEVVFLRDKTLYGYWYSGNTNVKDWRLSMTQNVQPVYGNENVMDPRYLKVGLYEFSLDVTTYEAVERHKTIKIATKTFTLTGQTQSEGYTFNGVSELGTYSHSFATGGDAVDGAEAVIIE